MSEQETAVRDPASTLRRSTLVMLAFWLVLAGVLWAGFSWWEQRQRAAIQHGLEPRVEGGRVQVTAAREGDRLMLQVTDDGQGFSAGTLPRRAGSFGLDQVFDRVASAYGGRGEVELQSHPGQGTTVRVRLPLG